MDSHGGLAYLENLPEWSGNGDFSLDSIFRVLDCLDNPQEKVPCVHIAGTNGKGSVAAAVSSILGASGAHVGLTISPQLKRMNERIVIDGLPILSDNLSFFAGEVKKASEKIKTPLTYFEAITASAFLSFHECKLDWAVLETGLGGRLDATNVVKHPACCAITSIDFEHEDILGSTLAQIAGEKAGIIKANSPMVVGYLQEEASYVISRIAKDNSSPFFQYGHDFASERLGEIDNEGKFSFHFTIPGHPALLFRPSLRGEHQGCNMAVAMMIASILGINTASIVSGVQNVFWPGRLEEFRWNERSVLMDCGHNPAGITTLVSYLKARGLKNLSVAFGVLQSKRWQQMVDLLVPYASEWNVLRPDTIRALNDSDVLDYLSRIGIKASDYGSDYEAFLSMQCPGDNRDMLVTGSMYMLGRLRSLMINDDRPIWRQGVNR